MFRKYERKLERDLQRAKPRLFKAMAQFANIRRDKKGWTHFRKRLPSFFPKEEYDKAIEDSKPSIADYPYCLERIWGGETEEFFILLGIEPVPKVEELCPEDMWVAGLAFIPAEFLVDWGEGVFRYRGACDFQRALYLLLRESWRARFCERCNGKFIARRSAQKYCSTDCSESVQRELKLKWWAEHGEEWRRGRQIPKSKKKGGTNGTRKTR